MKTPVDCIPCIIRQGLNAARLSTQDPVLLRRVAVKIMEELKSDPLGLSPALHSNLAYRTAREITGVADPYRDLKKKYNRIALGMYPDLKALIERSGEPLRVAVKLAAAGNVIDLGIGTPFDLRKDIEGMLKNGFARDEYPRFAGDIAEARRVMYAGDNAGEIVFDRLLIEEILRAGHVREVVYAVKGGPVINDAMREDAHEAGIDTVAKVVTTGSDSIGVDWERAGDEFRTTFLRADVIVSKGQGNFECLDERPENIYFILRAKCPCVAEVLGVRLHESVFFHR